MKRIRIRQEILNIPIDVISWDEIISCISLWAKERSTRIICICNVHSVITAQNNTEFRASILNSDIATPDGAPLAWVIRKYGHKNQNRINGPDLMWRYCEHIQNKEESIFIYGSSKDSLSLLIKNLLYSFPNIKIAGSFSPPYRQLTTEEDQVITNKINESGASVVWVGLGCPKQEIWMSSHYNKIHAVMIGVGAAFDYHAGTIKRAPIWMQRYGMEWFFRMISEPKRLMRRYIVTNSLFIVGISLQLFKHKVLKYKKSKIN